MGDERVSAPWSESTFEEHLRDVLARRYHHIHPFNRRMHEGRLSPEQIRGWIANRFYYQEAIPIKDALLLSKLPWRYRREWIQRIIDHDGTRSGDGGLEAWLRLGEAAGVDRVDLLEHRLLVPAARFACDAYVGFVRDRPWVEGVASSLTELSAPTLMTVRISAFEEHYPWVKPEGLEYFRRRVAQGPRDASQALPIVLEHCRTIEDQQRAVDAVSFKCDVLDAFLNAVDAAFPR
ncbi:MAG: pyrroloquinoline-quinone synthase PqqC [Bacillati bacterium ANGP1]|uniref:Pyrroloquinoline-quinone synthase n=1 Tax=Candidatus Segetimicrobium genomatis TaxID=2569760 RepID=A0A537LML8_9BACT|nr:MAG: pyrroloquinoline-quinone synthase PqqC [Terrabacteria group bacterium ANGP1]